MQTSFWVRRAHKWIGLVIGVQALLWMISGLYMVVVPLDVIHGDHLAHVASEPLKPTASRIAQGALAQRYPGITSLRLKNMLGKEVYEIRQGKDAALVDAATGVQLSPLDRDTILALADESYVGEGSIRGIEWVTRAPGEVGKRPVPLWAVHYEEVGDTTLYFSPHTGELVARRHNLWRVFDFVWMLHIMDYETRDDVNNTLLRIASATGLLFALSGAWLLFYSFTRRKKA
ncbi:MAG: PepSY domain-containing protein [Telluria sp.]